MKIRISTPDGYFLENMCNLAYCIAYGSYTNIHINDGRKIFSSYYLGKIERILKDYHFVRVNRSVIINLLMIKVIDKRNGVCFLDTGNELVEFKVTRLCMKKLEKQNII